MAKPLKIHQYKNKITESLENRSDYFTRNIPTNILTRLILHSFAFFYTRSLTAEAEGIDLNKDVFSEMYEPDVVIGKNLLRLRANSVMTQIGNLVLDCFMNINILQRKSGEGRIVDTNTYKKVIIYDPIKDTELLKLLENFSQYNISKLRDLEDTHIIDCKINDERYFKVIKSYLNLHAKENQIIDKIEKHLYEDYRETLNKIALDIGNHLMELLQETQVIKIVLVDLAPHPETKVPRKNIYPILNLQPKLRIL